MTTFSLPCVDVETAELYALKRLSAAAEEAFEEHLLICSPCIDRCQDADEFIGAFRAAASDFSL